jgi:hypothetical protein
LIFVLFLLVWYSENEPIIIGNMHAITVDSNSNSLLIWNPTKDCHQQQYNQQTYTKHETTVMSNWVSDWCLTPKQLFFSYVMARTSYNHIIMMMFALYKTCTLKLDLLVLAHWNNIPPVDILLLVDRFSLIRANKSLFLFSLILRA